MTERPPFDREGSVEHDDAEFLYQHAPFGYISTTPSGLIVKVNDTFLDWTGYCRGDLVGRMAFIDLLTGGGRLYHETHYAPMLRLQQRVRELALDIVGADGGRLPTLVNAVLELDDEERPLVVHVALLDATERREYERELLRAKERAEASEARAKVLAETLQRTLIPPAPPTIPGLEVAAAYRPAGDGAEVGGDFYDVFETGNGDWFVLVGDVCGKGVDAAVVTAGARYAVRAATVRQHQPRDVLASLNDELLRDGADRHCTAIVLRLRDVRGEWRVRFSCAGHPLPLLLSQRQAAAFVGTTGSLLGVFPDPVLRDTGIVLREGDALVLYTDGVTEGRRGQEFFGEQGLTASTTRHAGSATSIAEGILDDVMTFQGDHPRDDIVVVVIQVSGGSSVAQCDSDT
jgi:sigma-B regulation protein RsbU (phosphoserine phosphatase)